MNLRYRVDLSQDERSDLSALTSGGKHAARRVKRAQILLAADAGAPDETIDPRHRRDPPHTPRRGDPNHRMTTRERT